MKRIMTVATLMLVSILAMAQMQTPVHFSVSQKQEAGITLRGRCNFHRQDRQGLACVFHGITR